jgi:hypothetical protein
LLEGYSLYGLTDSDKSKDPEEGLKVLYEIKVDPETVDDAEERYK